VALAIRASEHIAARLRGAALPPTARTEAGRETLGSGRTATFEASDTSQPS